MLAIRRGAMLPSSRPSSKPCGTSAGSSREKMRGTELSARTFVRTSHRLQWSGHPRLLPGRASQRRGYKQKRPTTAFHRPERRGVGTTMASRACTSASTGSAAEEVGERAIKGFSSQPPFVMLFKLFGAQPEHRVPTQYDQTKKTAHAPAGSSARSTGLPWR